MLAKTETCSITALLPAGTGKGPGMVPRPKNVREVKSEKLAIKGCLAGLSRSWKVGVPGVRGIFGGIGGIGSIGILFLLFVFLLAVAGFSGEEAISGRSQV